MNRLFIALKIPKEIRENIISLRNAALTNHESFRWEPEDKIHLTLKFIGDVNEDLTEPIINSLKFAADYNCFDCRLTKFGFFYKQGQPKILWLGLSLNYQVNLLVERINKELEAFSIPAEKRKFQPHLTIKRLRGDEGSGFIESFESFNIPEIKFKSGEIALMKSDLLPGGSKYTEIKKYYLK
jgi:2'-5' RNA ligase